MFGVDHAEHPAELVARLCDRLVVVPEDPLAPEIISVPTTGIERWLSEQISVTLAERGVGDGIAANLEWPRPAELVRRVLQAVPESAETVPAWRGREVDRRLEALLSDHSSEGWLAVLDRFLRSGAAHPGQISHSQRLRAARRIRRMYSGYGARRPAMIRAWAEGVDLGPDGGPVPVDAAWQPRLWRLLRESIGVPSPAEILPGAVERLRSGFGDIDLPPRIAVYGLTALDPAYVEVLEALGTVRDVDLYVLYPSGALWEAVSAVSASGASPPLRSVDPTAGLAVNPVLRSWGRHARELQLALGGRGTASRLGERGPEPAATTLLGAVQAAVRANVHVPADETVASGVGDGDDRSIQIHACYGPRRQVEVLRDAILHALNADPSLEARDVVIMTPDLGTYAPLIEALFTDRSGARGMPELRVQIADRSPSRRNPLVRFVGSVLELAGSRVGAGSVRDLISLPMVQRRFGLDQDLVGEMDRLIGASGVRWGLDAADRGDRGMPSSEDHTWLRAMDRVAAGTFMPDGAVTIFEDLAPVQGVEGDTAAAAGALLSVVSRLDAAVRILRDPRPSSAWAGALATAVGLLAAPAFGDDDAQAELERILERAFVPDEGGADPLLGLDEVRVIAGDFTEDRPGVLHHRTGDMTVCTLVPMRSVPYRIVALLGLDSEAFPRIGRYEGDDLLTGHQLVGDRDRPGEDRQLLLDALMAAGDYFIVTYSGRDELTNAPYPPSVPIAELLDTAADMLGPERASRIVTEHPLQSFSGVNFTPGALGVTEPWGFDAMQLDGASALQAGRVAAPVPGSLSVDQQADGPPLHLDDLADYFAHPSRHFARRALGITIPSLAESSDDELPVEAAPLEMWATTDRILEGLVRGHEIADLMAHEAGRDSLPGGRLRDAPLEEAAARASAIHGRALEAGFDPGRAELHVGAVEVGAFVEGSVSADPVAGIAPIITPSRIRGKQRLALYLRVMFLSAVVPDTAWRGVIVGRAPEGDAIQAIVVDPLEGTAGARRDDAVARLERLIAIRDRGVRTPLPLFAETSFAWATAKRVRRFHDARRVWEPDAYRFGTEADDPYHRLLFPDLESFQSVLRTDFSDLAEAVWGPIRPLLRELR